MANLLQRIRARQAQERTPDARLVRSACYGDAGLSLHTRPYLLSRDGSARYFGPPERKAAAINKLFGAAHAEDFGEIVRAA